jgi:hypothetical protein
MRSRMRSEFSCVQFCSESESGYCTTTDYGEFWRYPLGVEALSTGSGKFVVPRIRYGVWSMEKRDMLHRVRLKMMTGLEVYIIGVLE